jgi:hypothetical protein
VQLASTIKFIELVTCKEGIASEAYRTALDLYEQNEQTFRATFQADKLMDVRILHFLDRVFQDIAADLSRFYEEANSIRSAAPHLRGGQRNTVMQVLGTLRYGIRPTISLSPGLTFAKTDGSGQLPGYESPILRPSNSTSPPQR